MLHAFDGRARSDAGASHVFPQSVLSAITLVRLESEDRVGLGCDAKLPLWSVAILALLREGSDPLVAGVEDLCVRHGLAPFPLSVCLPLSPHQEFCPWRGVLKQVRVLCIKLPSVLTV